MSMCMLNILAASLLVTEPRISKAKHDPKASEYDIIKIENDLIRQPLLILN